MPINNINVGTAADNGTGEPLRQGGQKINANFAFLDQKIDNLTKVSLVTTVPSTGDENTLYAESSTTSLKVWNGTSYDNYGGGGSATVTYQSVIDALGYIPEKKRTRKEVNNTTQYTVIAADFTDFELVFTGDTSGGEINVIINTGVCPNTEPSTGLQIVSQANHVLNYTGTATLTAQPGAILKTANDGTSVAITGIKPLATVNSLGVFGSLEGDGSGGAGEMNVQSDWNQTDNTQDDFIKNKPAIPSAESVVTNTEDGLIKAPNISGSTTYTATIDSPTAGTEYTEGDTVNVSATLTESTTSTGTKKKFTYDPTGDTFQWDDDFSQRTEKYIDGTTTPTYTLEAEDKYKFLSIRYDNVAITIPSGVFERGDIIKGYCYTGHATFTSNLGYITFPHGATNQCWGYFEITISSTSPSTPNDNAALVEGEFIKDKIAVKSSNGNTIWYIEVNEAGNITATDSFLNF